MSELTKEEKDRLDALVSITSIKDILKALEEICEERCMNSSITMLTKQWNHERKVIQAILLISNS